jgi:cytochrome P450
MADGFNGIAAVSGLDESFDEVIRALPDTLLQAPDDEFVGDEALSRDPFACLGRLRDEVGGVVLRGADGTYGGQVIPNVWGHDLTKPHAVALSHAAVSAIGSDRHRFVNAGAYGAHVKAHGATVNCLDGLEHRALRRLFDSAIFGRKSTDEWATAITLPTVEYLVARVKRMLADGETPDARRDLALPVAYKSISTIIGVPQEGFARFVALGETAQAGPRDMAAAIAAIGELDAYFQQELEARRSQPQPDMLTIMGSAEQGGRRMTDEEIVQHCRFLLPGGIETTWRQAANLVMCMLRHPEQYRAVVENPGLVDSTVEEALRWAPSGFVVPRVASEDVEVDGVFIPAGTAICSIQGIANRDPKVFERAEQFDQRREPNPHLTFHIGVHYCMGQNLARFILRTLLATLARELPTLAFAGDPEAIEMRGFGVRNPTALPLAVRA